MGAKVMNMRHVFVALVACVLLAATALAAMAAPSQAYAEGDGPYKYTIRVFGGNEGTYDGAEVFETTVDAGSSYSLDRGLASVSNDKYYVKGFRISGQDELAKEAFTVDKDMDFVVAYGVTGEMVSYTVSFVEYGTGNPLTADSGVSSVTFTGKVGDKPIVPYEYVTGYRPRYLNITGTLKEDGNNWTLEYIPLTAGETVVTETTEGTAEGGAAAGGAAAGTAEGGAAGGAAAGTEDAAGGASATPPETEEIGDVDNPLVSSVDKSKNDKQNAAPAGTSAVSPGLPILQTIGIIVAVVIVIVVIAALFGRSKKR